MRQKASAKNLDGCSITCNGIPLKPLRKASPSIVSVFGNRSINLNKVVATFEKHTFLSQTKFNKDWDHPGNFEKEIPESDCGTGNDYFRFC
jgi:hypothetical protein